VGAAADCETIGPGFLGQPVNALATLAFVAAGVIVLRRPRLRWVGVALIGTGIGSFLFHGPMPPGSEWAHDVTLAWLIAVVAGLGTRWERLSQLPALIALGILFALFPLVADPAAIGLTVLAVASLLIQNRSLTSIGPLVLLGAMAIFGRLGATGGPLCDPGSPFQTHAVWHLGAAAAVTWWALARPRDQSAVRR